MCHWPQLAPRQCPALRGPREGQGQVAGAAGNLGVAAEPGARRSPAGPLRGRDAGVCAAGPLPPRPVQACGAAGVANKATGQTGGSLSLVAPAPSHPMPPTQCPRGLLGEAQLRGRLSAPAFYGPGSRGEGSGLRWRQCPLSVEGGVQVRSLGPARGQGWGWREASVQLPQKSAPGPCGAFQGSLCGWWS